jgi:hypothetical protein
VPRFLSLTGIIAPGPRGRTGSSRTPHHLLNGTITPSGLHYERSHSGVPDIDPDAHRLLIHGLDLEEALRKLSQRRAPVEVLKLVERPCAARRPNRRRQSLYGALRGGGERDTRDAICRNPEITSFCALWPDGCSFAPGLCRGPGMTAALTSVSSFTSIIRKDEYIAITVDDCRNVNSRQQDATNKFARPV